MTYEELAQVARNRALFPEVSDVVVPTSLFNWICSNVRGQDAADLGRLRVLRSDYLQEGFAVARDHHGNIVRIWGPDGERQLPAQEPLFPLSHIRIRRPKAEPAAAPGEGE